MEEISAGAIVYTTINNSIKYLIIKDFNNNYGFPKGHIENNETELETAYREIKEEVGLTVIIDTDFKKEIEYIMPNGINKKVIYYLATFSGQQPHKQYDEVEEILLLDFNEASNIITFENIKEILIDANAYIRRKNESELSKM